MKKQDFDMNTRDHMIDMSLTLLVFPVRPAMPIMKLPIISGYEATGASGFEGLMLPVIKDQETMPKADNQCKKWHQNID